MVRADMPRARRAAGSPPSGSKRKRRGIWRKIFLTLFSLTVLGVALVVGGLAYAYAHTEIPQPKADISAQVSIVYWADGTSELGRFAEVNRQIAQFDQILGLVYVLLLLAVIIALVGIVNTLALSVYERTREIGLMRAVGMSRKQLRRMIRNEALVTATFGSLLGLAIGLFFGVMIVQSFSSDGITLAISVNTAPTSW